MCDSAVAVGSETASGLTLFAKNSDRKRFESQPFAQYAEAWYPPGATLSCTHIAIPQVAETYRVMGHRPWWVWGFEHGVNEHAVAIGNLAIFSNEPVEETPGLIGMDLVRLGLERGRTAREALEVIAGLVERHGQGGAALAEDGAAYHNAFVLADPREAWLLETSNRRWAARKTALGARSNHMSLRADWEIGSRDLEAFARSEGFWERPGRVDVAAAYRNPHVPSHVSEGQHRRACELLEAGRGRHDAASMQRLLRDHDAFGACWQAGATAEEERYFTLCAHSDPVHWTTASLVAELPRDRSGPWPVWISSGTPCTGVFLPVYLDGVLPPALARGGPEPDPDSAWWVFSRLQETANADDPRHTPVLREAWAEFEAAVEAERAEIEDEARAAKRSGDGDRARALVSDFMARTVEEALKRAEILRARIG